MSKFWIVNLFDKIFITICVFLLLFAWINFYVNNLWITFVMSTIFSLSIVYILFFIVNKKQTKQATNKKHNEDMDEKYLAFCLLTTPEKISILKNINKNLMFLDDLYYKFENKTFKIVFAVTKTLTQNNLIEILENIDFKFVDGVDIYCEDTDSTINTSLFNFNINFITKKDLFEKLETNNILLNSSIINKQTKKIKMRETIKLIFTREKSKKYLFCGFILIFSSILLPYHIYYLIFGSLLLIFALLCRILPNIKH